MAWHGIGTAGTTLATNVRLLTRPSGPLIEGVQGTMPTRACAPGPSRGLSRGPVLSPTTAARRASCKANPATLDSTPSAGALLIVAKRGQGQTNMPTNAAHRNDDDD